MTRILMICAFLALLATPALAQSGYSMVIEDLPLMPGMTEHMDEAVVFDKPGGRIVETIADSRAPVTEIEKFYVQALPALGWKRGDASQFSRESETLKLDYEQKNGETLVHFTLTPNSKEK